ncbi:MAG: hypothetical protein WD894_18675 [Pirellulales bacterium]
MKRKHEEKLAALAQLGRKLTEVVSLAGAQGIYEAIEAQRASTGRARLPKDVRNVLAEVSVRAARRIGELLAEAGLSRGGRPRNGGRTASRHTLGALRLSKNRSSRWQRLASIPADVFEAYLRDASNRHETPSVAKLLKFPGRLAANRAPTRRTNGSVAALHAPRVAAETNGQLVDLKDHLLHLGDLVESRASASAEKHAQAVDRRITAVLREMRDIVERVELGQ